MPQVTRGTSATLWTLGESAREDCVLLAHALPKDIAPTVYTSPDPKAAETAAVVALRLGLQTTRDARLSEVDRPPVWDEDYRSMVLALEADPKGDVIVSNHGIVLSLYAASITAIDLREFWRQLTFPDAWRLDLETKTLERLYEGGLPPE